MVTELDMNERMKMVCAMEYIMRQVNDEGIFFNCWLSDGVADGDIKYGKFDYSLYDFDDWYLEDENFKNLVDTFVDCVRAAYKSGGFYCGGVSAGEK